MIDNNVSDIEKCLDKKSVIQTESMNRFLMKVCLKKQTHIPGQETSNSILRHANVMFGKEYISKSMMKGFERYATEINLWKKLNTKA